jgi:hypothetical protein
MRAAGGLGQGRMRPWGQQQVGGGSFYSLGDEGSWGWGVQPTAGQQFRRRWWPDAHLVVCYFLG